jgi:hypothetical protein
VSAVQFKTAFVTFIGTGVKWHTKVELLQGGPFESVKPVEIS